MADPGTKKFAKIRALKCYRYVRRLLADGMPARRVARYIQEDRLEYTDVKQSSLATMLADFRQSEMALEVLAPWQPRVIESAGQTFSDRLQGIKRLDKLYKQLEYRMEVAVAEEDVDRGRDTHIDKQAKMLAEIILKQHQIAMDLGLTGSRDLGTLTISPEMREEIARKWGERVAQTTDDPVSRGKILAAVNLAYKLAGNDDNVIQLAERARQDSEPHNGDG